MGKLIRFLTVIALGSLVTSMSAIVLAPQLGAIITANDVGEVSEVELSPLAQRSVVYGADGSLYSVLYFDQNRLSVPLNDIPQVLVDTLLAVEDEHFWEHEGVNLRSTLRALFTNVSAGDTLQGGSTITQQLVKNSTDVGKEQTMDRKVREAVVARRIEDQLTKHEILERYLNTVYLGNTAYGVQAAAELYFGKDAIELDRADSALLVGMIQNPSRLDPFSAPEIVLERREEVVDRLLAVGRINEDEARFINAVPLPAEPNEPPTPDDPFLTEVRRRLLDDERLGATQKEREDTLFKGGLTIHTTIDPRLQGAATMAAASQDPDGPGPLSVALASVEPGTGAVRAIAGEPRIDGKKIDILTSRGRQPGSSFKPFVLAAYLENGGSPNDTIDGTNRCSIPQPPGAPPYIGHNYAQSSGGVMSLREAIVRSNNCAFLRLGHITGYEIVRDVARRFGLRMPDAYYTTTSLGTIDANPVEQAAAYATFASEGMYHSPYYVDRVLDRDGKTLLSHEPAPERATSPEIAAIVTDLLTDNVRRGTGTRAQFPDRRPVAGKTGTTTANVDAWFVGYIPQMSTAAWLGDLRYGSAEPGAVSMPGVTGGRSVAPIWGEYMVAAFSDVPPESFPPMPDVRPGTRAMTDAERQRYEQQQEAARQRARQEAARRAAAPQSRAMQPPQRQQQPAPPPPPSRPDRNPGGGGGGGVQPPPLSPPGDDG